MANNDGFIDFLSPNALADLKEGNALVLTSIENVKKLNQLMAGQNTPVASGNATNALTQQLLAQQNALAALQRQYTSAAASQRQRTQQTAEEAVNQGILNRNARQAAVINSTLAGAYQRLSAAHAKASRTLQDLIASERASTAQIRVAQREFDNLNRRVLLADRAVGRFNRNVGNYPQQAIRGLRDLAGAFGLVGGVFLAASIAKSIFDTTKELQGLDLALKQVIGSQQEAAATQQFLAKISEDYGVSINVLTKSYIGFYASAKNAMQEGKITGQQINDIFQSVAKASGALGLSVDQQQGAFLAIQQMISKGNIQAEELRGQLAERLPGAFGILAKSMGVTEIQLNKMLKDGKVLAAEVLPAFAKELEKAYGVENLKRVESLNAAVTRLGNSWTDFVRSLNDGDSIFSKVLAGTIEVLSMALKGAAIALESEGTKYNKLQADIRQKSYENTLAHYDRIKLADKAYLEDKKKWLLEDIKTLQESQKANIEANAAIREAFNKSGSNNMTNFQRDDIAVNNAAIKNYGQQIKALYGIIAAGDTVLERMHKNNEKSIELSKAEKKALEDLLKARRDNNKAQLELELQVIDRTLDDDDVYYTTRLRALELHRIKRYEISKSTYDDELKLLAQQHENGNLSDALYFEKRKEALIKYQKETYKIIDESLRKQEQLEKLRLEPADVSKTKYDIDALYELNKSAERNISLLEKQVEAEGAHKKGLEDLKKAMQDYIDTFSSDFFSEAGLSTWFDILNDKIVGFGSDAVTTALAVSEAFQEMFNFISQASKQNFDAEYEQNTKQASLAKQFAEGNAVAIAEIEKQEEAGRKEIRRRELKANRDLAKANILINSAQGIVAAFKDGNIIKGAIFAAVIAGITAVQLSALNNVPEYWKGTDNAPGGYAWVDERGPEIHTDKHGNVKSTGESKANLRKLEKGDKIIPHMKSKALMFDNGLNKILSNNGISGNQNITVNSQFPIDAFNATASRIENAVSNIPGLQLTDTVLKRYQRNGNQRTIVMNDRMSRRGKTNP